MAESKVIPVTVMVYGFPEVTNAGGTKNVPETVPVGEIVHVNVGIAVTAAPPLSPYFSELQAPASPTLKPPPLRTTEPAAAELGLRVSVGVGGKTEKKAAAESAPTVTMILYGLLVVRKPVAPVVTTNEPERLPEPETEHVPETNGVVVGEEVTAHDTPAS